MSIHRVFRTSIAVALFLPVGDARAHPGRPAIAALLGPKGAGTLVDESYAIEWFDSDQAIPTGTATIDLFFSRENPPTFAVGTVPDTLNGTPIVRGIPEVDASNRFVWDTRDVEPGTYWIWSHVNEPPSELGVVDIITFSPGVLTIAHAGDRVAPAVVLTKPANAYSFSDRAFVVEYAAFDPDGTGRVLLEATTSTDGTGRFAIAADLPATPSGSHTWDTSMLPDGDYTLVATLTDARGMSFAAFARWFVRVAHETGESHDATVRDSSERADGSASADTRDDRVLPDSRGCSCRSPRDPRPRSVAFALAMLSILCRRLRSLRTFTS